MAVGKYTFYVKDAKEEKATTDVEIVNSSEPTPLITISSNIALSARATATSQNCNQPYIALQFNSSAKSYYAQIKNLDYCFNNGILTIKTGQYAGDYYPIWNDQSLTPAGFSVPSGSSARDPDGIGLSK